MEQALVMAIADRQLKLGATPFKGPNAPGESR
jgi:hypothetical protein